LEPFGAQILGYAYGLDKAPGILTYVGAALALLGIALIDKGSNQREEENKKER